MNDPTSDAMRFRFPATRRLKFSREFDRVRKEGHALRGGLLMLGVLPVEGEKMFRVGLVTSRRVGGAVARNRVRRRLREIVRRNQHAMKGGIWFVVIARPAAASASSAALEDEWLRLAGRADLLRNSCSCS
jgi:ribonuclease P protein component